MTGALSCAAAQTILGASFVVSRHVLDYPTLTGQALRYVLAALILAPLAWRRVPAVRNPTRTELVWLAGLAASGLVGFNIFLLAALRHADAPAVGTVVGVTPLVLAIAGPLLVGLRPAPRVLAAAAIVVAGVVAVEGGGHIDRIGFVFALGTLLGEVLFSLLAVGLLDRFGPLGVSAWTCVLAIPMLVVSALACGEAARLRLPTVGETAALAYLGLFLTAAAFLAWYSGLHRLGAAVAGMFIGVVPVVSLLVAMLFDGVAPSTVRMVGAVVVGIGIVIGLRAGGTGELPAGSGTGPGDQPGSQERGVLDLQPVELAHEHLDGVPAHVLGGDQHGRQ
ncbi:MAG: DMT family transporter [Dactylosporangium sp.]|nr:DMT family transporter [Dactylosporangium sp.]NNJ63578.1 DMT family transporter [Dactylosporangium sp.]